MIKESLEAITALADLRKEFSEEGEIFPHIVTGRNMEPTIQEGAIIGIDPSDVEKQHLVEGEVYLFDFNVPDSKIRCNPILKRIVFVGSGWLLKDDSTFHARNAPEQKVSSEEIRRLFIGRVKWIVQKCY